MTSLLVARRLTQLTHKLLHASKGSRSEIASLQLLIDARESRISGSFYSFYQPKKFYLTTQITLQHAHPVQHATSYPEDLSVPPFVDEKLSYVYGRSSKQLKYCTLAPLMDLMSQKEPHSTAVVVYDEGISKSYEELNADINRLVNGMIHTLKLKRGDSVMIYSYNNYQFLLVQYACNKLGIILNPINPSYKAHEFSYVLGKAEGKVLFSPGRGSKQAPLNDHWSILCDPSLEELQKNGSVKDLREIVILDGDYDEKELPFKNIKISNWRNVFSSKRELDIESKKAIELVESDDIYGVYYTSGTTGFPKGAAITQFNVINNTALSCDRIFNQRGPKFNKLRPNVCLPLPLFHEFAGVLGVLLPFIDGGSIVLTGLRYSIQTVVESIIRFKCNTLFLTPTILIDLLGYVQKNSIVNFPLRTILIAGSSVMSELVHKTHTVLPELEELRIGYGSSENGVIATIQTSQEPEETKPFTVGPPLDFTEIRISDTNTGETTLIGQSGEVQTRGFNTMVGYYKDSEKTSEVITQSRWYKTGDLGIVDQNGSLQIVGRIKDLIIKGGENIYPAEVETVLHKHPAIEDAHVFGVPDKRFGEEVCTWIKINDKFKHELANEEQLKKDILEYCKQKLTYFKVPKYVMFVEEFPLTPVKKIKKIDMRAQTVKLLNL